MIEIRWCISVNGAMVAKQKPTATDALEYANERLKNSDEVDCCKTDVRLNDLDNVRDLLSHED